MEAEVLKENPLLIQKIIAERLSDKVQIMMVPTDGKFFFANDVLKSERRRRRTGGARRSGRSAGGNDHGSARAGSVRQREERQAGMDGCPALQLHSRSFDRSLSHSGVGSK